MLQLKNISKAYHTGNFTQVALDHVSVAFRDNEFVAILGPSGSGKTTLLNTIGGLDHYDTGDLVIDGVSTHQYKDSDWDTYRNNRVGFVFQSYNLIPHQSVLANVELALTLSGVSPAERRERAIRELERVGLKDHINKKPSQLSGGQMQRVAIARALINDPEILLADEPTGALDSKTSVQIMDLLTEIAQDRLVIMVTHNPALAEDYATRIVTLTDGVIQGDTDPFYPTPEDERLSRKKIRKTHMSMLTALSLSFQNLMTKKGRTIMTAFAGSIGIIGIATILSLANGINNYIASVEEETLSQYPLQITSSGIDMTSLLLGVTDNAEEASNGQSKKAQEGQVRVAEMLTTMFSSVGSNDLTSLKTYLDEEKTTLDQYTNAIEYSYGIEPQIYLPNPKHIRQVNPDKSLSLLGLGASSSNSLLSASMSTNVFYEMPQNAALYEDQYNVVAGRWPESYNEVVIVTTGGGAISDFLLYTLGLRNGDELDNMVRQFAAEEDVVVPTNIKPIDYEDILDVEFKLVNACDYYQYDSDYHVWVDKTGDEDYMGELIKNGETISVVGIVQPRQDVTVAMLSPGINYPASLIDHIIDYAAQSKIVKDQLADSSINVFTDTPFVDENSSSDKDSFDMSSLFTVDEEKLKTAFSIDEDALALDMDDFEIDPSKLKFDVDSLPKFTLSTTGNNPTLDLSELSLDPSSLDLSSLDLSNLINPEALGDLSDIIDPNSINLDLSNLDLSGISVDLSGLDLTSTIPTISVSDAIDPSVMSNALATVMAGYTQWLSSQLGEHPEYMTDPSTAVSIYLAQPDVQTQISNAIAGSINSEKIQQDMQAAIAGSQDALKEQIASQVQSQVASQIQSALLPAIQSQLQSQISSAVETGIKEKVIPAISQQIATNLGPVLQKEIQTQMQSQLTTALSTALPKALEPAIQTYMTQALTSMANQMGSTIQAEVSAAMEKSLGNLSDKMSDAFSVDPDIMEEAFSMSMDEDELAELIASLFSTEETTYDSNLRKLGYASPDNPSSISIYPKSFEDKEEVLTLLDNYNNAKEAEGKDDQVITYTDFVGALMTSVTDIINMISYVLIAFVAISLVVSSIMIGIITYISVLERKKEIGILRAIGASKGDISRVFNAETVIVGLTAGLIGIGITALVCIPANAIVYALTNVPNVALLPWQGAIILVAISVLLTFIAGLFPSRAAAREDPVEALRSE